MHEPCRNAARWEDSSGALSKPFMEPHDSIAMLLRDFPAAFRQASAYFAFHSLLQLAKTLQEPGRCKQAESPTRKTPGENRRQVKRSKGRLGRGVTGLRSKRLANLLRLVGYRLAQRLHGVTGCVRRGLPIPMRVRRIAPNLPDNRQFSSN